MSTITLEQQQAIAAKLASMHLPSGLGDEESACSIAAINLALTGELTDDIPPCMSEVIGKWIIKVQDSMPDDMRNSDRWKQLLPRAAGTGRAKEKERLAIILDWMWESVLPTLQPLADKNGFGREWQTMTTERTKAAAEAAAVAAWAARAARAAESAAVGSAVAAVAAAEAAEESAWAAEESAARAAVAAVAAAESAAWETFDPCGLLERLIEA